METFDRELEEQVLVALRQITRAISLHSHNLQQKCGLTGPQLVVLRELDRRGEATGGELARAASVSHATVTGILDRLEKRGLVLRSRSALDKRRVPARLTEEGTAVLRSAPIPLQTRFVAELRKLEPWERTSILSCLQRVAGLMLADVLETLPGIAEVRGGEEVLDFLPAARHSSGDRR